MKLTLGFSPCPNDTFIFDALVNKKIDTGDYEFETALEDVETLNKWALGGKLALSKISYGVLPLLLNTYNLLDAGGALGKGVGPLLIAKPGSRQAGLGPAIDRGMGPGRGQGTDPGKNRDLGEARVAIPGKHTTAHLLFSLAYPEAHKKEFMVFSGIEEAVLNGLVDCGVIIHENRFTYQQKGLVKLMDLGNFWEQETGCPIPLGGIVIRKDIGEEHAAKINALIRKSVEFAFANYPELPDYVRQHAQEMDERVMRQHIDLYVNDYSLSLGEDGRAAIRTLLDTYERVHA